MLNSGIFNDNKVFPLEMTRIDEYTKMAEHCENKMTLGRSIDRFPQHHKIPI